MTQQSTALAARFERDAAEARAVHMRNVVVLRQPLVQPSVIRLQQVEHAAVLAQHVLEKQFRLATHRLPQVVIEVGKQSAIRRDGFQVSQIQPLPREVRHERLCSRIGKHPPRLPREHFWLTQHVARGDLQQFVIGNAAPEEERQPRRQLQIAESIRGLRGNSRRLLLDAEQELATDQDRAQRGLDAGLEIRVAPRVVIKRQDSCEVRVVDRTPIRPPHQRCDNLFRTGFFLGRRLRSRDEDAAAAGRVPRPFGLERAGDRHLKQRGRKARMAMRVEVRVVRLPQCFQQRRRVLQKRHAQVVRPGRHRHPEFQMLIDVRKILPARRRLHRERFHRLAVEQHFQLVRLMQPLDMFVAIPRETNLNLVLAFLRKLVANPRSAARADRQTIHALFLSDIRWHADRVPSGRPSHAPNRELADVLRRRDVAVQQRRREFTDSHIVEPVAGLIHRQPRRRVDVERQQIANRVLILCPIQPPQRRGPSGIRPLRRRAIERVLKLRQNGFVGLRIRPLLTRRRHLPPTQPANDFLPNIGMPCHFIRQHTREIQPTLLHIGIVTWHAKLADDHSYRHWLRAECLTRRSADQSGRQHQIPPEARHGV